MGFPGGFKLNENLDNFLGVLFLFYIERWSVITSSLSSFGNTIVNIVAGIGFVGGLSMQLSVAMDIISFSTFQITSFYTASARVYSLQLNVLSSLWKLFRGKKYNPLKGRIDTCDYDTDQLLLGTLLFTLIFFLLPTTMIYYLFFASVKLILNIGNIVCLFVLELLGNFPLFGIFIFVMRNGYLPGGIYFDCELPVNEAKMQTNLIIKNRGFGFGTLFFHFQNLFSMLFKVYSPGKLLKSFFTGTPLAIK